MKRNLFLAVVALGFSSLLFTSCEKYPQVEVDATKASIEEAVAVGAEMYVHADYVALQDSLKAVMVNVESEKSKFFKKYTKVKEQLAAVSALAGDVKMKTEARKEELKLEIQNIITELTALIETDKQLMLDAPKGKEGASALVAIKGEVDGIEASLAEITAMFEKGELLATIDKANAAKDKANAIKEELTEVISKYKKVRR